VSAVNPASASSTTAGPTVAAGGASPVTVMVKNVCQEYPSPEKHGKPNLILSDISLSFERNGINMLLGPSGCGKSTLLRMLGGVRPFDIVTPTSGSVLIDGIPCAGPHDDAVMVFQQYANRPDLTVFENVIFPLTLALWRKRVPANERQSRAEALLEAVGLADKRNLFPHQLSGGQNQRVALARALALRPRILLMDEPFGALDAQTREEMQALLVKLYQASPCLVMFVTHDVSEALLLGDRVIVFSTQPATISDDFTINEARPRSVEWLRSPEAVALQGRVLTRLHQASSGRGSLRVGF
jgi:ABC-type nitrate/sulfonate/bicarbonate transport system ATPase subunit